MAKNDWFGWGAAFRVLLVGITMLSLLFARNKVHRARESSLEGNRRSTSIAVVSFATNTSTSVSVSVKSSVCFDDVPSPKLQKFVDPLPILRHVNVSDGQQHVMKAYKTTQVSKILHTLDLYFYLISIHILPAVEFCSDMRNDL